MESIVPTGTDKQDDEVRDYEIRGVLLPVLDDALGRGALTRRESLRILDSIGADARWRGALDSLSQRTREKWQVEDDLSKLRSSVEELRNEWLLLERRYLNGERPTNGLSAQSAAARLSKILGDSA